MNKQRKIQELFIKVKREMRGVIVVVAIIILVLIVQECFNKINLDNNNMEIEVKDVRMLDLFHAGIYPSSESARDLENDCYKKGMLVDVSVNNNSEKSKTLLECNLIIEDVKIFEKADIEFFPMDNDDGSISIYALNNGNLDLDKLEVKLASTFQTDWSNEQNINYNWEEELSVDLLYGEVKEIYRYDKEDLDLLFENPSDFWLHVFAFIDDTSIGLFNKHIAIIQKFMDGFTSETKGWGDSVPDLVAIFFKYDSKEIDIINLHPQLMAQGTTDLLFLLLPDQSITCKFHLDLKFSDGKKYSSPVIETNIFVPIYDDEGTWYDNLREAVSKSGNGKFIYGRGENLNLDFMYDPKNMYDKIKKELKEY